MANTTIVATIYRYRTQKSKKPYRINQQLPKILTPKYFYITSHLQTVGKDYIL